MDTPLQNTVNFAAIATDNPNSDETFLSVEGTLLIDLDHETIELSPGQLFTVQKGLNHRTRPKGPRSVNLTFELRDMETVKTQGRDSGA